MSSPSAASSLATPPKGWWHRGFEYGVALKGVFAGLEILGGALLLLFGAQALAFAQAVTLRRVAVHPHDPVAAFLAHVAAAFSIQGEHFYALFFMVHGAVKLVAVIALLRERRWAFPFGISVLSLFLVYQLVCFYNTGSPAMLVLSLFDLGVIALIVREYRAAFRAA